MDKLKVNWIEEDRRWLIKFDGKELKVPKEVQGKSMNTFKKHHRCINGNYIEFESGLKYDIWSKLNHPWVSKMFGNTMSEKLMLDLYNKIKKVDFIESI